MKITDVEPIVVHVNQRGDWVFVLIHTDEGISGLGEASSAGNDELLLAVLKQFKRSKTATCSCQRGRAWDTV